MDATNAARAPIINDRTRCLSCAGCVAVCRPAAIRMDKLDWRIEPPACNRCGACVSFCPNGALRPV